MAAITSLTEDAIIALVNAGTWPPNFPITAGSLINVNDTLPVNVKNASNVVFHVKNVGTVADTTGVVVFEGSVDSTTGTDGNWFIIQVARTNDNTIETSRAASSLAPGVSQGYAWEASVTGIQWFRIRQFTAASASSSMRWSVACSAEGSDPVPSTQTHPVTVSGTATVSVSNTPAVTVSGTPNVAVTNTPAVTVSSGAVTNTPAAGTANSFLGAASINATVLKASAGSLMEIALFNPTAALIYVKLYNKATTPAPATDSALLMDVIPVPINGRVGIEFGALGKRYPSGIGLAIVANPANTDATAVAVGVVVSATYL